MAGKLPAGMARHIDVRHARSNVFLRKTGHAFWRLIAAAGLFDWSCDYDTFLRRKDESLALAEEKQNALFDKKLAEEEAWIRQGIKARRTRNEGRVRALKRLRMEHTSSERQQVGNVNLRIQQGQRSGQFGGRSQKRLVCLRMIRSIVDDFSTRIFRGDKVGIIGPNGSRQNHVATILLGKLDPTVRHGADRHKLGDRLLRPAPRTVGRRQDRPGKRGDGYEHRERSAGRSQHIIGYLQNFLFSPDRVRTPGEVS